MAGTSFAVALCVVVCAVMCAPSLAWNTTAPLHMMSTEEAQTFGARCLDGSNYGFYISANSSSTKWVIFLEGGGYCATPEGCAPRLHMALGSSKHWSKTLDLYGIYSDDPTENPEFFDANKVFLPYCSGDLHSGQQREPQSGLYFAGHLNFQRTLQVLVEKYNGAAATDVVLAGSSAGGLGTFNNADFLRSVLPPDVHLVAVPVAGWFINVDPTYHDRTMPILEVAEFAYSVWDGFVDQSCKESSEFSSRPYYCYSANYSFSFIDTPLFIVEANYDINQLYVQDGCPGGIFNSSTCEFITDFGALMRSTLEQVVDSPTTGLFLTSCLIHVVPYNTVVVNGLTWQQALGLWYASGGQRTTHIVDRCPTASVPCNPTCGQPVHVCSA